MSAVAGPVQVFTRQVYGQPKVYPFNRLAEQLAELAGVKTFSNAQVKQIRAMGFTVEQVQDPALRIPQP